jgi:hypothetical protein
MISESEVGDRVREKSGGCGTEIVRETVAAWLNAAEVPVKVIVELPAAAVAAAVSVTVAATPGLNVTVAGLALTPVGNPEIATATLPVNPLVAVAVRLTVCAAAPAVIVSVVGAAAREKSGAGVGIDPPPPPQPSIPYDTSKKPAPAIVPITFLHLLPALPKRLSCG